MNQNMLFRFKMRLRNVLLSIAVEVTICQFISILRSRRMTEMLTQVQVLKLQINLGVRTIIFGTEGSYTVTVSFQYKYSALMTKRHQFFMIYNFILFMYSFCTYNSLIKDQILNMNIFEKHQFLFITFFTQDVLIFNFPIYTYVEIADIYF